jgi:hypothetical protein
MSSLLPIYAEVTKLTSYQQQSTPYMQQYSDKKKMQANWLHFLIYLIKITFTIYNIQYTHILNHHIPPLPLPL